MGNDSIFPHHMFRTQTINVYQTPSTSSMGDISDMHGMGRGGYVDDQKGEEQSLQNSGSDGVIDLTEEDNDKPKDNGRKGKKKRLRSPASGSVIDLAEDDDMDDELKEEPSFHGVQLAATSSIS